MKTKCVLTGETMPYEGRTLHRIKTLRAEELDGFAESEENLSRQGQYWISDDATLLLIMY